MICRTALFPSQASHTNSPSASSSKVLLASFGTRRIQPAMRLGRSGALRCHLPSPTRSGGWSLRRVGLAESICDLLSFGVRLKSISPLRADGSDELPRQRVAARLREHDAIARRIVQSIRDHLRRHPPRQRVTLFAPSAPRKAVQLALADNQFRLREIPGRSIVFLGPALLLGE